ncbi:hypothetical protein U6A24_02820 [Aquimarina gracilis]|uniref:Uncharacterized protein n=1 Tax=Aquimarina gracilis TaxID=874422 RepID=A0ABU5ZRV5_9FLAO|nr:hypothetical protein [Aquimarina gracilis]MEB3344373.1 hypothetical protein [Aquimarina gracilis]
MEINCFYFGKYAYTFVPWQIEEDILRIKSTGAHSITLNVIEQDYKAAKENIVLVISVAQKHGLKVYVLPDGWCNVLGGVSQFPSVFAVKNMDSCLKNSESKHLITNLGPVASILEKRTIEYLKKKLKECFEGFAFDGILWYQCKLHQSFISKEKYEQFFSGLHFYIKDHFGSEKTIDWYHTDSTSLNTNNIKGLRYITHDIQILDHRNYTKESTESLTLEIENLFRKKPKMFCYFDYPANVELPEKSMTVIRKTLQNK